MGLKLCSAKDIGEKVRKIAWPSKDDVAQRIYEKAKDKELVNLKYEPTINSYVRRAITIGLIAATMFGVSRYINSRDDGKKPNNNNREYNEFVKYSSNYSSNVFINSNVSIKK